MERWSKKSQRSSTKCCPDFNGAGSREVDRAKCKQVRRGMIRNVRSMVVILATAFLVFFETSFCWSQPTPQSPGTSSKPGERVTKYRPTFRWQGVSGASKYGLYISKYPYGPANLVYENETISGSSTSFTLDSDLEPGRLYRWNMRAYKDGQWTAYSGRLYFYIPPPPPEPLSPGTASSPVPTLDTLTPLFQWNASRNASYYAFYIKDQSNKLVFDSEIEGLKIRATSYRLPPNKLSWATMYRWNMRAWMEEGGYELASDFSHILGFQTASPPSVETRNATGVSSTEATINGSITNDGGLPILERRFDWGTTPDGSGWKDWTNNVTVSGKKDFYYRLTNLKPGTTYYFRAWAKNAAGWSYGSILSFGTPPSKPSNPSPADGATDQPISLTLSWSASGAQQYDLYFGTSANLLYKPYKADLTTNQFPIPDLQEGTTYYWKVVAKNQHGQTSGDVWRFTTKTSPVTRRFSIDDRVCVTFTGGKQNNGKGVSVRPEPGSGDPITFKAAGAEGVVKGGPSVVSGLTWWKISWASGHLGWSAESGSAGVYLEALPGLPGSGVYPSVTHGNLSYRVRVYDDTSSAGGLNTRESPGLRGDVIKRQPPGSRGWTLDEQPVKLDGMIWWLIKWDDGTIGWSADSQLNNGVYLVKEQTQPFSRVAVLSHTPGSTIDFGDIKSGTYKDIPITITNDSSSIGILTGTISITGQGFRFLGSSSFELYPGYRRIVTVRFEPTSNGDYSGTLTISHNATSHSSPITYSLRGRSAKEAKVVELRLSPVSVNFGSVGINTTSEQVVRVENSSNSNNTLNISNLKVTGEGFQLASGESTNFSLSPGQYRDVRIQFKPTQEKTYSGELQFTHNATNKTSPYTVPLQGSGVIQTFLVTISGNPSGAGKISINTINNGKDFALPFSERFANGTSLTVQALPNSGYEFAQWSGDASGTSNPLTVVVNRDKTITANFRTKSVDSFTLNLNVYPQNSGKVRVKVNDQWTDWDYVHSIQVPKGSSVTIEATPSSGFQFSRWSGDVPFGSKESTSLTVVMDGNRSITAHFADRQPPTIINASVEPTKLDKPEGEVTIQATIMDNVGVKEVKALITTPDGRVDEVNMRKTENKDVFISTYRAENKTSREAEFKVTIKAVDNSNNSSEQSVGFALAANFKPPCPKVVMPNPMSKTFQVGERLEMVLKLVDAGSWLSLLKKKGSLIFEVLISVLTPTRVAYAPTEKDYISLDACPVQIPDDALDRKEFKFPILPTYNSTPFIFDSDGEYKLQVKIRDPYGNEGEPVIKGFRVNPQAGAEEFVPPFASGWQFTAKNDFATTGKSDPWKGRYHAGVDIQSANPDEDSVEVWYLKPENRKRRQVVRAIHDGEVHAIYGLSFDGDNLPRWDPESNQIKDDKTTWWKSSARHKEGDNHGYGITVILKHQLPKGKIIYSLYAHLRAVKVGLRPGSQVKSGEPIGLMGRSHYETPFGNFGEHLHLEVRTFGSLRAPKRPDGKPLEWNEGFGYTYLLPTNYGYLDPKAYIGHPKPKKTQNVDHRDRLEEIEEKEPNDDADNANLLVSNIKGIISTNGDVDYFKFESEAGSRVSIWVNAQNLGSTLDAIISISDGKTVLAWNDDDEDHDTTDPAIWHLTLPYTGTYYIKVESYDGSGSENHFYALYLRKEAPDDFGNDFDTAHRIISGDRIQGTIGHHGDVDVFRFEATAGEYLNLDVRARRDGSPLDAIVTLYDADGNQIAVWDDVNGHDPTVRRFKLPVTGTYYLKLTDFRGEGGEEFRYTLSLEVQPTPQFSMDSTPVQASVEIGKEASAERKVQNVGGGSVDFSSITPSTGKKRSKPLPNPCSGQRLITFLSPMASGLSPSARTMPTRQKLTEPTLSEKPTTNEIKQSQPITLPLPVIGAPSARSGRSRQTPTPAPSPNDWRWIIVDPAMSTVENSCSITKVYLQRNETTLYFRIETSGRTFDPANTALYINIDTDINSQTGAGLLTNFGADYMVILGEEADGLLKWNNDLQSFEYVSDLAWQKMEGNVIEMGVPLSQINITEEFGVFVELHDDELGEVDRAPDESFVIVTPQPEWLRMEPLGGTTDAGQEQVVTITIDGSAFEASGEVSGTVTVYTNDLNKPKEGVQIPVTVNVQPPQLPFESGIGLFMVSLPISVDKQWHEILGIPEDQMKLAIYEPTEGRYRLYSELTEEERKPKPGVGVWIKLDKPVRATVTGSLPKSREPFVINLKPGWQIIGVPWQVKWANLKVRKDGNELTFQQAAEQRVVHEILWTWDPEIGDYQMVWGGVSGIGLLETLDVLKGYWVYAFKECQLVIPPKSDAMRGVSSGRRRIAENGFVFGLAASNGQTKRRVWLGFTNEATGRGRNERGLQAMLPPESPEQNGLKIFAINTAGKPLAADVRFGNARKAEWDVIVKWDAQQRSPTLWGETRGQSKFEEIRMTWDGLGYLPKGMSAWLIDTVTGARRYLRTQSVYSFRPEDHETQRHFKVILEQGGVGLLRIMNLRATPTRGREVLIQFELTKPATTHVEVLTLTGRKVALVETGRNRSEGQNTVVWRGVDSQGGKLPNGIYLIRVCAQDEDGRHVQAVTTFMLR